MVGSISGEFVRTDHLKRFTWMMLLFCFVLGMIPVAMVAQKRGPSDYRSSYYYQAYDQGFRAGRADYLAGRPYGYHVALVTTAGLAGISQDYRNAFKLGYQDGYANHDRDSEWYYRHHRHDCDCDVDDDGGRENWSVASSTRDASFVYPFIKGRAIGLRRKTWIGEPSARGPYSFSGPRICRARSITWRRVQTSTPSD